MSEDSVSTRVGHMIKTKVSWQFVSDRYVFLETEKGFVSVCCISYTILTNSKTSIFKYVAKVIACLQTVLHVLSSHYRELWLCPLAYLEHHSSSLTLTLLVSFPFLIY